MFLVLFPRYRGRTARIGMHVLSLEFDGAKHTCKLTIESAAE
ncbi:MAG: hypothetical protein ABWY02_12015 [Telluria sp.]